MKTFLTICAISLLALWASATDFPPAQIGNTTTNILLTGTTNATGTGVFLEKPLYHTFHLIDSGTNIATVILDRSLDNTNWIPFATNLLAASSTAEVTATGKWSYFRARLTCTNTTLTVKYLGQ